MGRWDHCDGSSEDSRPLQDRTSVCSCQGKDFEPAHEREGSNQHQKNLSRDRHEACSCFVHEQYGWKVLLHGPARHEDEVQDQGQRQQEAEQPNAGQVFSQEACERPRDSFT